MATRRKDFIPSTLCSFLSRSVGSYTLVAALTNAAVKFIHDRIASGLLRLEGAETQQFQLHLLEGL